MMTEASAWLWREVKTLEHVQFPWRWQMFAALGVALLLAASLESLRRTGRSLVNVVPLLSILISVYLFACALVRLDYGTNEIFPFRFTRRSVPCRLAFVHIQQSLGSRLLAHLGC